MIEAEYMAATEAMVEAEYLAAKEAYLVAQRRLSAAKAARQPIIEARKQAQFLSRVETLAKAAEAFVAGAPLKTVCVMGGRSAAYGSVSSLLRDFWDYVLSHEEIYHENGDIHAEDWEKRVTARALARYHERIAA